MGVCLCACTLDMCVHVNSSITYENLYIEEKKKKRRIIFCVIFVTCFVVDSRLLQTFVRAAKYFFGLVALPVVFFSVLRFPFSCIVVCVLYIFLPRVVCFSF